jgi:hypothetical protein
MVIAGGMSVDMYRKQLGELVSIAPTLPPGRAPDQAP